MSERGEGRRHLKAIMFTDIKDYSAKMSRDERRTVELVLAHREIVRETLPAYQGEEHEIIGDAFVVLFDSVVNAVHCGVEIQRRLAAWNAERPPEEQVWIRIGIHLGDIILRDGGIYGDGVNIAARVEQLAEPGGICLTEEVRLQIRGKLDYTLESLGRVELKNISQPPPVYRLLAKRTGAAESEPGRLLAPRRIPWAAVAAVIVLAGAWYLLDRGPGDSAPPPPPTTAEALHRPRSADEALQEVAHAPAARLVARALDAWLAAEFSAAERHLDAALEIAPSEPMPLLLRSSLRHLSGRDGLAQLDFEQVQRLIRGKTGPVAELVAVRAAIEALPAADPDEVRSAWRGFADRHPKSYLGRVLTATPHHAGFEVVDYIGLLDEAIRLDPNPAVPYAFQAQLHLEAARWDQAQAAARRGLQRNPGSPWLAMLLARVDLVRGEAGKARSQLLAVLDKEPGLLAARSHLATAELLLGNEDARRQQAAVVMSPATPGRSRARFALDHGRELVGRGRLGDAFAMFDAGARAAAEGRQYGTALDVRTYTARIALEIGDDARARRELDAARGLSTEPELSQDYRKFMVIWLKRVEAQLALSDGRTEEALAALERLRAMPDDAFTFYERDLQLAYLAWPTFAALGRFDDALQVAREHMYECYRDHAEGQIHQLAGDQAAAAAALTRALASLEACRARHPNIGLERADALSRLAALHCEANDFAEAREAVAAFVTLWPDPDPELPMVRRAREVARRLDDS